MVGKWKKHVGILDLPRKTWHYRLYQKPNGKHGANNENVKHIDFAADTVLTRYQEG